MVRRQTSSPWNALDQVGERARGGFGRTKLETNEIPPSPLPHRSVQHGLNAELLSVLLENYKRLASNELERRS